MNTSSSAPAWSVPPGSPHRGAPLALAAGGASCYVGRCVGFPDRLTRKHLDRDFA